MHSRRALLLGTLAVAGGGHSAAAQAAAASPRRLLLVGDSITMGSAGDWTWRYRLWRHLRSTQPTVDLVGDRNDMWDNVTGMFGDHDYLDPNFDQDHNAVAGRTLSQAVSEIRSVASSTAPDLCVVLLGTNDLASGTSPEQTAVLMQRFIRNLRAENRSVKIVLAQPPHSYLPAAVRLGALLVGVATSNTKSHSRVIVAHTQKSFTRDDTWDGLHPNARGEIKIAAGVADALARLGVGTTYPRPLPQVAIGPREPAQVSADTDRGQVRLSYASAPGVDREYIWLCDVTAGGGWTRLGAPTSGGTWTSTDLAHGHRYRLMLQPAKGWLIARHVRSRTVAATIT